MTRVLPAIEDKRTYSLANVDEQALRTHVQSYLRFLRVETASLEARLIIRFLCVYHFEGYGVDTKERASGWVISGETPFLFLSDEEISNPFEALALYAWFELPWVRAKGVDDPPGSIPDYRLPPNWDLMTFNGSYETSGLSKVESFIAWKLIPAYQAEIVHPEIRERCKRRGWFREDLYGARE